MGNKTWKATERKIASKLGGSRVPVSGRGDGPDVAHDWLAIEVKHRRIIPQWLTGAMAQAQKAATASQLPVAVLHEHGRHDSLVVMSLSDFVEWFGQTGAIDDE